MVINKYLAEFMGTLILVGVGTMAIIAVGGPNGPAEIVAIAFAFGLALLAGIWVVGHVSGAHFNPAVTLGMLLERRMSLSDAIGYWIGQFAGATVGSLIVLAASGSQSAVGSTATTYADYGSALIGEIALSAIFVWTILAATKRGGNHAPAAIGLVLTGVHLALIPVSGSSVNPARSFGPALVGDAISSDLWLYMYAPLIGAVIAWGLYRLFPAEETMS